MSTPTADPSAPSLTPAQEAREARRAEVRSWCKRFALGALIGSVLLYTMRGVGLGVLDDDGVARWMLLGPRSWEIPARETLQRHLLIIAAVVLALGEPWRRLEAGEGRAAHPYELTFCGVAGGAMSVVAASSCLLGALLFVDVVAVTRVWFSLAGWPLHLMAFVLGGCASIWLLGGRIRLGLPSATARAVTLALPVVLAFAGVVALGARDDRTPTPDPRKRHEQMVKRFGARYTTARARILAQPAVKRFFGDELQAHPHKNYYNFVDHVGPWSALLTSNEAFAPHDRAIFTFDVSGTARAGHCAIAARWFGDEPRLYREDLHELKPVLASPRPLITCVGTFKRVDTHYLLHDKEAKRWRVSLEPIDPRKGDIVVRKNRRWGLAIDLDFQGKIARTYVLEEGSWSEYWPEDFLEGMGADGKTFPIVGAMPQ